MTYYLSNVQIRLKIPLKGRVCQFQFIFTVKNSISPQQLLDEFIYNKHVLCSLCGIV